MMAAQQEGQLEIVESLIQRGANVNSKEKDRIFS
jgi:hypothetical protein